MNSRELKSSRAQELKSSRTQELKNSRTQELKNSRTQELKNSRTQESRAEVRVKAFLSAWFRTANFQATSATLSLRTRADFFV
jgi:hypothetical protein